MHALVYIKDATHSLSGVIVGMLAQNVADPQIHIMLFNKKQPLIYSSFVLSL
jgi:hypothetical protein